jgi:hypothetical protein
VSSSSSNSSKSQQAAGSSNEQHGSCSSHRPAAGSAGFATDQTAHTFNDCTAARIQVPATCDETASAVSPTHLQSGCT